MYYLVEFSIENVGDAPISVDQISMRLRDGTGNTYLLSPSASDAGEHGPLSGDVEPGASTRATAGYLVPELLPSGSLIWIFSPHAGSGEEASVRIPYDGGMTGESPPAQADATVTDAFLSKDGDTLVVEAEVRNTGATTLTVESTDINLSSTAGIGELTTTAPPLPWSIPPGRTQVIELQYQEPGAPTALLELLGYSFEIGGLQ
jgi:hypothetical protein